MKQENVKPNGTWKELTGGDVVKLEEGQAITGIFRGMEESKMYSDSFAVTLEVEGQNKVVFVNNIVRDKLERNGVRAGNEVRILFIGKKKNEQGTRQYNDYAVFVK